MRWSRGLARPRPLAALAALLALAVPAAAEDLAYVTVQNGNGLSILDLAAGTERARIDVPGKPAGVAVAPGAVFVVSPEGKTLRRFDPAGAETGRLALEGGPMGVAVAGGRVFVSDWYNARIWAVDGAAMTVATELVTGSAPAGLAVSPDGRWLASADRDADQVSVFDLATLGLHARIPVGSRPFGLGFAPDGRLFAGNVGSDDVSVLDPEAGKVLATLPVGARPYGVAFAAGRAFVTNQYADTVSVIDLATLAPLAEIAVGEYPEGIDSTGDGRTVVVANWFSNSVSLIDAETLTATGEIETGDGPRAFGRFVAKAP
ncbi:YncE family protein [Rhodovulum kholense]|uniref:YVTN family beta-propeller protein n=1 Tax=Rhodovulum kholense TaxID=453584 RepID=A0A8E2VI14_9RHOB|nr:YncE family protein [Rhodovulum kholense]PTW42401.1 YVTN family beta-propeller protein [Rhodovulum kholense]